MVYFNPNIKLFSNVPGDKERIYDYLKNHKIIIDYNLPDLEDDNYTQKRMEPIYRYLKKNKDMNIVHKGTYYPPYGGLYFAYDANFYTSSRNALKDAKKIADCADKYMSNN